VGWEPRKHSWARNANLLFVDNPVGTGFSYVEKGANFSAHPPQHTVEWVWLGSDTWVRWTETGLYSRL